MTQNESLLCVALSAGCVHEQLFAKTFMHSALKVVRVITRRQIIYVALKLGTWQHAKNVIIGKCKHFFFIFNFCRVLCNVSYEHV